MGFELASSHLKLKGTVRGNLSDSENKNAWVFQIIWGWRQFRLNISKCLDLFIQYEYWNITPKNVHIVCLACRCVEYNYCRLQCVCVRDTDRQNTKLRNIRMGMSSHSPLLAWACWVLCWGKNMQWTWWSTAVNVQWAWSVNLALVSIAYHQYVCHPVIILIILLLSSTLMLAPS